MRQEIVNRVRRSLVSRGECLAQAGLTALHRGSPAAEAAGLVILDDYFPNLLTGFRIAEFNEYLRQDSRCRVLTIGAEYERRLAEYQQCHPQFVSRIARWHPLIYLPGRLAYCVFLNNAARFLPIIERRRMPFVFTLYPGGGFRIGEAESDAKLRRACASRGFRKVIATQTITRDYLLDRQLCRPEQVELIYGGVFPSDVFGFDPAGKRRYGRDKETLDICFVANKYMPRGVDKGYDVFIDVAQRLAREVSHVRFHVAGGFGPNEIDISGLEGRIEFYGPLYRDECRRLYAGMDLILSPNVPFRLFPGAFDGFPTGCCIEAGLSGVAVFCTDLLGSNIAFADGAEIVIIPYDAATIAGRVLEYLQDPERLYALADRGQRAFARVFDLAAQMGPRFRLLAECAA